MVDDSNPDGSGPPGPEYDAQTLASLMDGTRLLEDVDEAELSRILQVLGPEELLRIVGAAPKLQRTPVANIALEATGERAVASGRLTWRFATAAAVVLLAFGSWSYFRSAAPAQPQSAQAPLSPVETRPAVEPAPLPAPILLLARAEREPAALFRGDASDTREPRDTGHVTSVDGETAAIDLGAVDGLEAGAVLRVVRANDGAIGTLTVSRVFRERATGRVGGSVAEPGDAVQVPEATRVTALIERGSERLSANDLPAARRFAERAAAVGGSARSRNDSAELLNDLAVVLIRAGRYVEADEILATAQERASGRSKVPATANRGAVAALRGDARGAEAFYRQALDLAGAEARLEAERQSITTNLNALLSR